MPKFKTKAIKDTNRLAKLQTLLEELKVVVSKPTPTSFLTPVFLTWNLNLLDQVIQKAVAPISKFAQMLPQNSPSVVTGVQGGESKVSKGDSKVVGKVFSTQIPVTIPMKSDTISTTIVTTKSITKGIVIGSNGEGGSSSSVKANQDSKDKGKGVLVKKTKEENKVEVEAEIELQRHIQSILRLRASDPPGMEKGHPRKL